MSIHNSKITYTTAVTGLFLISLSILNNQNNLTPSDALRAGLPIATSNTSPVSLIPDSKSAQIPDLIFSPTKTNPVTVYANKTNDTLDKYLINIFCSEVSNRFVKVASGSGIFLSNPDETDGVILTNAHVARHLLDGNKKCVGRTGSPTATTHTITLRYIPSYWLDKNQQYVIGDPDQSSTGEFDFAIVESKKIKPTKVSTTNIYSALKISPKFKLANYDENTYLSNVYVYSYPAGQILNKNVYNPLFQKKDAVRVSAVYSSPTHNIQDSLLDVVGSRYVDHGSSGGLVVSQGTSNSIIGLSSILIQSGAPQTVRVVTIRHVLTVLQNDLKTINNAQTDSFLVIIQDILNKKEVEMSPVQIFKNIKLTSVLEQYTRDTLRRLNIIR